MDHDCEWSLPPAAACLANNMPQPVYIINATYMLPVTLYVYYKYGRPRRPEPPANRAGDHSGSTTSPQCHSQRPSTNDSAANASQRSASDAEKGRDASPVKPDSSHCCRNDSSRPMWATVLVGVSHCGAGCVLGDLVGEWLVYGTGATINGAAIWVELLVDYAFALLFGIAFQYFSIAPMSGEYGLKTVWRAAKADILSLTSFEVGAFAWMIIYQVGIFDYRLEMTTWTYWWMMQVGMVMGFGTAMPMNWFLISKGIKEPCA